MGESAAALPDGPSTVNSWLASLGGKLAERWLVTLMLPGVAFVGAAALALTLGHGHWSDTALLRAELDRLAASPAARGGAATLLVTLGLVTLAVASSAAAQGIEQLMVRIWTGPWGRYGRPLVRRRRRRWDEAAARHEDALREKARLLRSARQPGPGPVTTPDTVATAAARDRIAPTRPQRPTWTGDRMLAVGERVRTAYDLDLATVWPRLWLVLPDEVRVPLAQAQTAFTAAARTAAWGILYLALGLWWWPAAAIGTAVLALGRWRGRESMEHLAELVESAVDLHVHTLAAALGHRPDGPFTPADGESVTRTLRKGY
ncbi:hypothetical protein [Kitasatospora sp. NPDC059673]|uniref:hypothetical protein n=1 Tax=Kitasatospora sp. NPDC059673 TaxID=3346901 RepID=UPI00368F8A53